MQVEEFKEKAMESRKNNGTWIPKNSKYYFNGIHFDSSWEVAYYIYLSENNIPFEYHPKPIEYFDEFDNKTHQYFPDFLVNDRLQEIKGNQFFDENNNLIDFYDTKRILNAKMKCMKENNVEILRYENIEIFLKYVNGKYGRGFLETLKK